MGKHKKKDKKHSKHKKQEKRKEYSSSESGSSSCDEWVENAAAENVDKKIVNSKRDEWMDVTDFVPTISNSQLKDQKRKAKQEEEGDRRLNTLDKPGQHERELNPYWKDGGRGLPTLEKDKPTTSTVTVGDGGLNWLRRALRRVTEQAQEEGRTEEEVAAECWGSLQNLKTKLQEAEEKAGLGNRSKYDRHGSGPAYNTSRRSNDEQDYKKEISFQRPRDDAEYSRSDRKDPPRWQKNRESPERTTSTSRFRRPDEDSNVRSSNQHRSQSSHRAPRWQKHTESSLKPNLENDRSRDTNRNPVLIDHPEDNKNVDQGKNKSTISDAKDDKPSEPAPLKLTKKEMNELGAKLIKAELLGNAELAETLKARLNSATEVSAEATTTSSNDEQVVVLTQSNMQGLVSPLVCGATPSAPRQGRNKKQKLETHRDGERMCYFPDDSKYSLNQMFQKEKLTSVDDETELYLKMSAGKTRVITDDDFTIDDAFLSKQMRQESEEKQAERQKYRAINEHKQMNSIMENCRYCLDSKQMQKHLIVAIGKKAYLSLPSSESLEDGHCYIVPMTHVPAVTHVDEDVWEEMQLFRQTLTGMFKSQDKDTVFMETSLHLRRHPHAVIECVPLSVELGCMAPMYFKKAILECDTEWAQNKRLVDLSKKNIRHSVPKGLPYFAIDFGLQGGFAHVVEDEQLFPDYFGHEIVGGMLDCDPYKWRKPRKQNFKEQSEKVLEFEKWWKPFDCTTG